MILIIVTARYFHGPALTLAIHGFETLVRILVEPADMSILIVKYHIFVLLYKIRKDLPKI